MRRTREEFIERWKHDLIGMMIEAMSMKGDAVAKGMLAEAISDKIKFRLGQYWDDLAPVKIEPPKEPPKVSKDSSPGHNGTLMGKPVGARN